MKIKNQYQALVQGLLLSITAPREDQSKKALRVALSIAYDMCKDEDGRNAILEKAKREVELMLLVDENEERPN